MARRNLFQITTADVAARAAALATLDLTEDRAMVRALNDTVDEVYETARGRMIAGINLTDAYVQSKMAVEYASPTKGLSAAIIARGGPGDQSPLGRYFLRQETQPVKWDNEKVAAKGGTPSTKWPGWTWRKGDAKRGIPAGQKQAGVAVEVGRGQSKVIKNAFTMPLRRGGQAGGNGLGIFTRTKYGLVQHRYGPAVYQLFRVQAGILEESLGDKLERIGAVAEQALDRALQS